MALPAAAHPPPLHRAPPPSPVRAASCRFAAQLNTAALPRRTPPPGSPGPLRSPGFAPQLGVARRSLTSSETLRRCDQSPRAPRLRKTGRSRTQGTGSRTQGTGSRTQGTGSRTHGGRASGGADAQEASPTGATATVEPQRPPQGELLGVSLLPDRVQSPFMAPLFPHPRRFPPVDHPPAPIRPSIGTSPTSIPNSMIEGGAVTVSVRPSLCPCCATSRRHALLGALSVAAAAACQGPASPAALALADTGAGTGAGAGIGAGAGPGKCVAEAVLAAKESRPEWVDELYTWLIGCAGDSYEQIIRDYKEDLLGRQLAAQAKESSQESFRILELGIGTGTNFQFYPLQGGSSEATQNNNSQFYPSQPGISVTGVDPSRAAERYAQAAASRAGLTQDQFTFIQGVGEGLPAPDNAFDAVVSTLVLCSVADLRQTVNAVRRVLRPGGRFYFLEHVAAPEGTRLRRVQGLLDPLQGFVADGCHLTRDPFPLIAQGGGFGDVRAQHVNVEGLSLLSPHLIGSAAKVA